MENNTIDSIIEIIKNSAKPIKYSENTYLITTPFFNNLGEPFTVAVVIISDNNFILTDLGHTLEGMKDVLNNVILEAKINKIMEKMNVKCVDGQIFIKTDNESLLFAYDLLIRSLILIDNVI